MLSRWSLIPSACLGLLVAAQAAFASSPSAWEEFRRDVETACRDASAAQLTDAQIVVDPFGLQSYGLAFLSGTSTEDGMPRSVVCIYDKVARSVEIGGEMALERAVPAMGTAQQAAIAAAAPAGAAVPPASGVAERLLSPSALSQSPEIAALQAPGQGGTPGAAAPFACDAACAVTLGELTEDDRAELVGLADQIERTVAANAEASLGAGPQAARDAAEAAARAVKGGEAEIALPGAALAGSASCTLYYFGFSGEAARTVGTHQCRISESEGGGLLVEKTSGERLRADLRPLAGPVSAFVGRTFPSGEGGGYDRENPSEAGSDEFGNTVGFATEVDGQLILISSQRRRFDDSDSFFWVLALDPA